MGAPTIVCVEVERPSGRLRKWEDTLSAHVGQVDSALGEQEVLRCLQADEHPFSGRIEYGTLGEMLLCKFAATNYEFSRSLTTPSPTLPIPMMFVSVSRGSCRIVQCGHTCTLTEGDWTLIDTKQPLGYTITSPEMEAFVMMLPRPSDAAIASLVERGIARQSNVRWGLSRILHAMVKESFGEMRRLSQFGKKQLGGTIATMAWDALREQIETPQVIGRRDELPIRVKGYIEAKSRRSQALGGANRARMQHFPSWVAPPVRRGSGRIRIALSLAASAPPLRGGASRPEPGTSLDHRRLLLMRL